MQYDYYQYNLLNNYYYQLKIANSAKNINKFLDKIIILEDKY